MAVVMDVLATSRAKILIWNLKIPKTVTRFCGREPCFTLTICLLVSWYPSERYDPLYVKPCVESVNDKRNGEVKTKWSWDIPAEEVEQLVKFFGPRDVGKE